MMKLIEDCPKWWRMWSIQLAALFAAIAAAIMANPSLLLGLIGFVPERLRPFAAVVTFVVTFIIPTLARLLHQPAISGSKPDA